MARHAVAGRPILAATRQKSAGAKRALAGKDLDKGALTVTRNAGDADDLAGVELQVHILDRDAPVIAISRNACNLEGDRRAAMRLADRARRQRDIADHHSRHGVIGEIGYPAPAGVTPVAEDCHRIGKGTHLAELVRDHQNGDFTAPGHAVQQPEYFIGLAWRQHGGRLVKDQAALIEIELLDDLELLLLAGGEPRNRYIERHSERHMIEEGRKPRSLAAPVDHAPHVVSRDHQVLGTGQRRHQHEILVHEPDADRMRLARIGDGYLATVDRYLAGIRSVEACDTLDQRRLARPVFAEEGMESCGRHLDRDVVERNERAEGLSHAENAEFDRLPPTAARRSRRGHRLIASSPGASRNAPCDREDATIRMRVRM